MSLAPTSCDFCRSSFPFRNLGSSRRRFVRPDALRAWVVALLHLAAFGSLGVLPQAMKDLACPYSTPFR